MTRFLADENFPKAAVTALRQAGLTVEWILEDAPGSSDELILARIAKEHLVRLTFDKGFGELAVIYPGFLRSSCVCAPPPANPARGMPEFLRNPGIPDAVDTDLPSWPDLFRPSTAFGAEAKS